MGRSGFESHWGIRQEGHPATCAKSNMEMMRCCDPGAQQLRGKVTVALHKKAARVKFLLFYATQSIQIVTLHINADDFIITLPDQPGKVQ